MAKKKTKSKKKNTLTVRLVSSAGTGHFYTTNVPRKSNSSLVRKKYDPTIRSHVTYKQAKI